MEGSTSPKNDVDKTKASQDSSQESLIGANWPSLPVPADSQGTFLDATQDTPIQPAQKSPTPWKGQQRGPADYERDRVEKYAKYFKGNEILPIPELEKKTDTQDPLAGRFGPQNQTVGGAEEGDIRRVIEEGGHPMPVLLSQEFCDVGCPPSYGRPGCEAGSQ